MVWLGAPNQPFSSGCIVRNVLIGAAALGLLTASPAMAASSVTLVNGACSLATGCLFTGNIAPNTVADAQAAYNAVKPIDITLNFLGTTDDGFAGNGLLTGNWALPGYAVNYLGVKAGNQFMLYSIASLSSGTWSTAGLVNPNGKKHPQLGLSHLAFFGSAIVTPQDPDETGGAVPEPSSWAMMIAGFGFVGSQLRRRKVSFA